MTGASTDEDIEEGGLSSEAHGADAEGVGFCEYFLLQGSERGVDGAVANATKELSFGLFGAACAVSADADAEYARGATFALRAVNRVEEAFLHAVEVASGVKSFVG